MELNTGEKNKRMLGQCVQQIHMVVTAAGCNILGGLLGPSITACLLPAALGDWQWAHTREEERSLEWWRWHVQNLGSRGQGTEPSCLASKSGLLQWFHVVAVPVRLVRRRDLKYHYVSETPLQVGYLTRMPRKELQRLQVFNVSHFWLQTSAAQTVGF